MLDSLGVPSIAFGNEAGYSLQSLSQAKRIFTAIPNAWTLNQVQRDNTESSSVFH